MDILPEEVHPLSLFRCRRVNKTFLRLLQPDFLWERICRVSLEWPASRERLEQFNSWISFAAKLTQDKYHFEELETLCKSLPICVKMKMMSHDTTKFPLFMIFPQVNDFALPVVGERKRKKLSQLNIISHWWETKESSLIKVFEGCLEQFLTENERKKFYNIFCALVKEDGNSFKFLTGDLGIVGISSIRLLFLYSDIKNKNI